MLCMHWSIWRLHQGYTCSDAHATVALHRQNCSTVLGQTGSNAVSATGHCQALAEVRDFLPHACLELTKLLEELEFFSGVFINALRLTICTC